MLVTWWTVWLVGGGRSAGEGVATLSPLALVRNFFVSCSACAVQGNKYIQLFGTLFEASKNGLHIICNYVYPPVKWVACSFEKKKVSRGWFRSIDLWVMGPARSHCATLLTSGSASLIQWIHSCLC